MTQEKCVRAYKALEKLMVQNLTLPMAVKVFNMHRDLQKAWDFQLSEERKIIERHPNVDPVTATVKYEPDDEKTMDERLAELDSFVTELGELGHMEQEIEIHPFSLVADEEIIKIAGTDIRDLQGFVSFI